jgi:predicted CXXCH cytochrome family protein
MQTRLVLLISLVAFTLAALLFLAIGLGNSIAIDNLNHPHRSVACRNCHSLQSTAATADSSSHKPASTAQCLECHAAELQRSQASQPFHQRGEGCERCHSFHQPRKLYVNGDSTYLAIVKDEEQLCTDCHRGPGIPQVSPGHQQAAALLHGDFSGDFRDNPSEFCLACHDVSRATPLANGLSAPQLHLTASHPYDIRLIAGYRRGNSTLKLQDQIDPALRTSAGNITCITCHTMTSAKGNLLVMSIEDGLCDGCHDMGRQGVSRSIFTKS